MNNTENSENKINKGYMYFFSNNKLGSPQPNKV